MIIALTVSNLLAPSDPDEYSLEEPYPGAQDFVQELTNRGHEIIIHDVRANDAGRYTALHSWLIRHGIHFDDIWTSPGKPQADWYVQEGDYVDLLEILG